MTTHTDLMRGDDWVRCCICFDLHVAVVVNTPEGGSTLSFPSLAIDDAGIVWDVCKGFCAESAGIVEP